MHRLDHDWPVAGGGGRKPELKHRLISINRQLSCIPQQGFEPECWQWAVSGNGPDCSVIRPGLHHAEISSWVPKCNNHTPNIHQTAIYNERTKNVSWGWVAMLSKMVTAVPTFKSCNKGAGCMCRPLQNYTPKIPLNNCTDCGVRTSLIGTPIA